MASRIRNLLQNNINLYVPVIYGSTAVGSLYFMNEAVQMNKGTNYGISNKLFDAATYGMFGGLCGFVAGITAPILVPLVFASCVVYGANVAYDKFTDITKVE